MIHKGLVAAVVAPFFIALGVMVVKHAGQLAPPLLITAYSALMSVPILVLWQKIRGSDLELDKLFNEVRGPFLKVLITRSLIGSAMLVIGFTLTSAVKSILLLRLEALFVFAWSVYFKKERATSGKLSLLLALVIGSVLVVLPVDDVGGFSGKLNWGDLLIVVSLIFFSYSYIPTEAVVAKVAPTNVNIVANTIGGITVLLVALIVNRQQVFALSQSALILIFAYSCLFSVVGINLYYFAFKTVKPWIIACFLSLEVVYGIPLAWCMHGEVLTAWQAVGAVIVVAATTGIGLLGARESQKKNSTERL